jgi:HK97 gp10 family phage protein
MGSEVRLTKNIFAAAGIISGDFAGILETAILVANEAKTSAPVQFGRLKNSIMYKVAGKDSQYEEGGFNDGGGEKAQGKDKVTLNPQGQWKPTAYVGTNLEYAVYQEYGTRRQKGRAFMRPALQIVFNPGSGVQIKQAWEKEMAKAFRQKRIVTQVEVRP